MLNPSQVELDVIKAISQEASKYKALPERYNPFVTEYILTSIKNEVYSSFLNKKIKSIEDAAWHAKCQTDVWSAEDESIRKEKRKIQNRERQKEFQLRKKQIISPEAQQAYDNWKNAIAQRNQLKQQWDIYVDQLHQNYLAVKISILSRNNNVQ